MILFLTFKCMYQTFMHYVLLFILLSENIVLHVLVQTIMAHVLQTVSKLTPLKAVNVLCVHAE